MYALGRAIFLWPLFTSGAEVVVLLGLWRAEVRKEKYSGDFGAQRQ